MAFFVYILQCCDGSYYTGYTKDLDERSKQHFDGKGAKYTRSHKPLRVAYVEVFDSRGTAMKREREIKKLGHQGKMDLILSKGKK
jgi:putative endonuclease